MQIQLTFGVVLGIAYVLRMGYLFLDPDTHYCVKRCCQTQLNHMNSWHSVLSRRPSTSEICIISPPSQQQTSQARLKGASKRAVATRVET